MSILTMITSAQRNAMLSPLLRLPAEIQNPIVAYLFNDCRIRITHKGAAIKRINYSTGSPALGTKSRNIVAITETCRQIYTETALLPFCLLSIIEFDDSGEYHRWWVQEYLQPA